MRCSSSLMLVVALSFGAAGAMASPQSDGGLFDSADAERRVVELEAIVLSAAGESEKAAALHLLGRIFVARADYAAAARAWGDLVERYPESSDAEEAEEKLDLVAAILACREQACSPVAPVGTVGSAIPVETLEAPALPSATAADVSPIEAAGVSEEPPAATEELRFSKPEVLSLDQAVTSGTVIFAGFGTPLEIFEQGAEQLIDFLRQGGVDVVTSVEGPMASRGLEPIPPLELTQTVRDAGAVALIHFTCRFGFREYVAIEAFDAGGASLWKERVRGGTALEGGRIFINDVLMKRLRKRLEPRMGGPGLPIEASE